MHLTAVFVVLLMLSKQGLTQDDNEIIKAGVRDTVEIKSNFVAEDNGLIITVMWKRDGEDVAMYSPALNITTNFPGYAERALIVAEDYTLMLSDLTLEDSGEYEFSVITTKGSSDNQRTLEVLASPVVSAQAISVKDDESDTEKVVAECTATGGSSPFTIAWYDGDLLLADTASSTDSANAENPDLIDSVLQLRLVPDVSRDNGRKLRCLVVDALGKDIPKEVTLEVTEPTTTVPTTTMQAYPMITKFPKSKAITLLKGESRVLTCKATGVPEPTVTWYKDDKALQSGVGESRVEVIATDYIDGGSYKCMASNDEGTDEKKVEVGVQGPPKLLGVDVEENGTTAYILDANDEYVRLLCASNAYPVPEIEWIVDGANLTDFEREHHIEYNDGTTTSFLNISTKHFIGPQSVSKIFCKAKNVHGEAKKTFEITVPVVPANIGLIVGIVLLLVLIVLAVVVAAYCVVTRRRQGTMTTKSPETGICGWATCCAGSKVKSKELKEEDDTVTVEHVKEVNEEGTQEEKQKLTQAEEEPAKEDEEKKSEEDAEGEKEATNEEEEKPKKNKRKIALPMQCCKGKKKEPKADTEEGQNNDAEVDEETTKENGNGDTKTNDEKQQEETDKDSGKGDTLEKVLEEEKTEK